MDFNYRSGSFITNKLFAEGNHIYKQNNKTMTMNKGKRFWAIGAVSAFVSVISFFQINSYFADKHHINGLWWVSGIVFAAVAGYFMYKANNIQDY